MAKTNKKLKKRQGFRGKKTKRPGPQGASAQQETLQRALALHRVGHFPQAEALYRQVLLAEPNNYDALHFLGMLAHQAGKDDLAVELIGTALSLCPDYVDAHHHLGNILNRQGRLDEAVANFRRALALRPDEAALYSDLGNTLMAQGKLEEAMASFRQALTLKPDYPEAHYNQGMALMEQGQPEEAVACFRRAIALKPDYVKAHINLGALLRDRGRTDEAVASFRRALALQPDDADTHNNLGNALKEQGKLEEAVASFRRALALKPDFAEAHFNLGITLRRQGKLEEAIGSYRRALDLKPDFAEAHSNFLFCSNYLPDQTIAQYLQEARQFGRRATAKVRERYAEWNCAAQPERLRVGLISGDFGNHPVGFFLDNMLANIDPSRIELIAYPTIGMDDELTPRLRSRFAAWKPLSGLHDGAAARLIHDDGVHVLIDLAGHTNNNRLPVFAWKPAPVQVTWLGYSASTGVAEMDYLLGDPYVVPAGEESHFTETVWRLPESYLCLSPPQVPVEVGPLPACEEGRLTFGSFNNAAKMNDRVVALWAKVLHAVPDSRLFLKAEHFSAAAIRHLTRQRFADFGVTPERLLLEGYVAQREGHLAAYNRVDIALDPFPYNGTTTSAEGLWMGVPFLTRRGDRFIAHVGESIAHNTGMADWIARDDEDYVAKAVAHAGDLEKLARLRAGLREQVLASPLFDAPRFARNFEAAMWEMWWRFQSIIHG